MITVIITVIVDALSFVERYPALTCSADMLRRADCSDMACSLRTQTYARAQTGTAEIWALSFSHVLSTAIERIQKQEFHLLRTVKNRESPRQTGR